MISEGPCQCDCALRAFTLARRTLAPLGPARAFPSRQAPSAIQNYDVEIELVDGMAKARQPVERNRSRQGKGPLAGLTVGS